MFLTTNLYHQKEEEFRRLYQIYEYFEAEKEFQTSKNNRRYVAADFTIKPSIKIEKRLIDEMVKLKKQLQEAILVEEGQKYNLTQIGSLVKLQLKYDDDDVIIVEKKLCETPDTDTITLNSPIGRAIFQQKVGFSTECIVGDCNVKIKILEIK